VDDQANLEAEIAAAKRLGRVLIHLRESANLTQRKLGRRSNVAWTFIQLIEAGVRADTGRPVTPAPPTLLRLAAGLAVDGSNPERKNPGKAAGFYRQMMEARGWATSEGGADETPGQPTVEELREGLTALAGAEAGIEMVSLAEEWYQLTPESRRFLLNAIKYVRGTAQAAHDTGGSRA